MTWKVNVDAVRAGERIALARTISQVEDQTIAGRQALSALFPFSGQAHLIGITGSGAHFQTPTARR
jgi:LAO/AO transport system kinase